MAGVQPGRHGSGGRGVDRRLPPAQEPGGRGVVSRPRLYRLRVDEPWEGERLDRFLAAQPELDLSRTQIQRLIRSGDVTVNGAPAKASSTLKAGQEVMVFVPPAPEPLILPESFPIEVVYEDEDLLVINKPRGMVVHPAPGHETGTLVNALLAYSDDLSLVAGTSRPGIVHRLDKDTTGLMLVAKTDAAHRTLSAELKKRLIERRYLALVHGVPEVPHGMIDAPIGRHPEDRIRMAVRPDGRSAWTEFWVRERFGQAYSLVECKLYTGRTHQIRVHMAYIGHPVAGDPLYGPRQTLEGLGGQALHAYRLSFTHPRTRERMTFQCPPPEDFQQALERLRAQYGSRPVQEVTADDAGEGPHS
nr:RNA pseudouridine synthase [Bacillota bacterium]